MIQYWLTGQKDAAADRVCRGGRERQRETGNNNNIKEMQKPNNKLGEKISKRITVQRSAGD